MPRGFLLSLAKPGISELRGLLSSQDIDGFKYAEFHLKKQKAHICAESNCKRRQNYQQNKRKVWQMLKYATEDCIMGVAGAVSINKE